MDHHGEVGTVHSRCGACGFYIGDMDQQHVDTMWADEISNRVDDILSGRVETIPGEEVFAAIEARLAAREAKQARPQGSG